MNKICVAIDTSSMDRRPGMGTAIFTRSVIQNLLPYRDVLDVTLVHRQSIPEDPIYKEFNEIIIPKIRTPKLSNLISDIWFYMTTKQHFDIYYYAHYHLPLSVVLAPAKKIVSMQYDGGDGKFHLSNALWLFWRWYIDAFIVSSQFGKEALAHNRKVSAGKIHILFGGTESIFHPLTDPEAAKKTLLEKYQIAVPYIVASGRLDPHKNILTLVRAYDILYKRHGVRLPLIVTGGVHEPEYSKLVLDEIKNLGLEKNIRILRVDRFQDMPLFYGLAEFMIFPSLREGFGLPLVEAMACGVPTIASRATSLVEVGGEATRFIDPYDPSDIAEAMKEVLENKNGIRETLVTRGFEQAKKFTWQKHAEGVVELYKKLMNQ